MDQCDIVSDSSGVGTSNSGSGGSYDANTPSEHSLVLPGMTVVCTEAYSCKEANHLNLQPGDIIEGIIILFHQSITIICNSVQWAETDNAKMFAFFPRLFSDGINRLWIVGRMVKRRQWLFSSQLRPRSQVAQSGRYCSRTSSSRSGRHLQNYWCAKFGHVSARTSARFATGKDHGSQSCRT